MKTVFENVCFAAQNWKSICGGIGAAYMARRRAGGKGR